MATKYRVDLESFIQQAKSLHGEKYDYSRVEISQRHVKVEIVCPDHGSFWQTPHNHTYGLGQGCAKCGRLRATSKPQMGSNLDFIHRAEEVHGKKYDYSKVEYFSRKIAILIGCLDHGFFQQSPASHLQGSGCPECSKLKMAKGAASVRRTSETFIAKAQKVHGDRYDYSNTNYVQVHTKVWISCREHGPFQRTPSDHVRGSGCPKCIGSSGELHIIDLLTKLGIKFETQKTFEGCVSATSGRPLKFDFYLPESNLLLEYDGEQHFRPAAWQKNQDPDEQLAGIQARDEIKNQFCLERGRRLVRISYKDSIDSRIKEVLAL
jgi:very-short-patch-repair endonuclease